MKQKSQFQKQRQKESSELDCVLLDSEVQKVTARSNSSSLKFSIYALRTLLNLSDQEAADAITDGSHDRGIDAIIIDENRKQIHLFQFKYHEAADRAIRQFPGRSVDNTISFIEDLLGRRAEILDSSHKFLQEKILQIWDLMGRDPLFIHVHFVSNGRKLSRSDANRLQAAIKKYDATLHQYGATELAKGLLKPHSTRTLRRIQFVDETRCECKFGGMRMLTGFVSITELARLVSYPDAPLHLDEGIFSDNVRGVLSDSNEVNRSIERTLTSGLAAKFGLLNNGVTVVAEQVLYQAGGNFPVQMVNPQIVNGCQTASIIHKVCTGHQLQAEEMPLVRIEIIECGDEKLSANIALARNSQTRIYGRDLRAIDELQLKIERALKSRGYTYLRKRSDESDKPHDQTIDMARIGQLILAYYKGLPEKAKTNSNDIFGEMYDLVFDTEFLAPDNLITAHVLGNLIEERRQLARQRLRNIQDNRYHEEWIIEGHLHVLFVIGLLCQRDAIDLSNALGAAKRLHEAIEIVDAFALRHRTVAAYRLFRSVSTSDELRNIVSNTKRRPGDKQQLELL